MKVIKGLQLHVSSAEVVKIATDKASEHKEKGDRYVKQRDDMESAGAGNEARLSHDVFHDLKRRIDLHEEKASWFTFLAAHIPPERVYELALDDLRALEVTTQRW